MWKSGPEVRGIGHKYVTYIYILTHIDMHTHTYAYIHVYIHMHIYKHLCIIIYDMPCLAIMCN